MFNRVSGFFAVSVSCALALLPVVLSCNSSTSTDSFNTWSFTGYVLDGHGKRPLVGASISYTAEDGTQSTTVTDAEGAFQVSDLPFGERTFRFSYTASDSAGTPYTDRLEVVTGRIESSASVGELGDVSKVINLFPLNGAITGKVFAKLRESELAVPAVDVLVRVTFKDEEMENALPKVFDVRTDSTGAFSLAGLPVASGATISIAPVFINDIAYARLSPDTVLLSAGRTVSTGVLYLFPQDTTDWDVNLIASNVISRDGFGLTGLPVTVVPYYILSRRPDSTGLEATIEGGGSPMATVSLHGDTVFVHPVRPFTYNELIAITITGSDTAGNRIALNLGGIKRFRTEKGIVAVASNTWVAADQSARDFELFDTLWVKFSQRLDTSLSHISWQEPAATHKVYGSGPNTNARVWIHLDTLFVQPDARLQTGFGETMGFKVVATGVDGSRSSSVEATVNLKDDQYYVVWSNTRDQFGAMRTDFGTMEPVKLISNMPIAEITGISPVTGAISPSDLTLDNISLHGDTIVYQPSLRLESNASYGVDFNITFADGLKRQNVLAVSWKTLSGVRILNTNNRQSGSYRPFAVWGDTLKVTFSRAIDTSASAPTRFKVNLRDVNGQTIRTGVAWDSTRTRAAIHFLDTLPSADFGASPAYTVAASATRAVDSVSFDITTIEGEQAYRLGPQNEYIEIHTEAGLCPVNANILDLHDTWLEIGRSEPLTQTFPVNGDIRITFNREIDTALLQAREATAYVGIEEKSSGIRLPCTVQTTTDAKTLIIHPVSRLVAGKEYYVWLTDIPGKNIAGAAAIDKHAGSFSGKGTRNRLTDSPFITESPGIRTLTAQLLADSNTALGVKDHRLATSAGFSYNSIAGAGNTITDGSIKFRLREVAWNQNHRDSVLGYQVQVRKVERRGSAGGWFTLTDTIPSIPWGMINAGGVQLAEINLMTESFYNALATPDRDVSGSYYLNGSGLFNDSVQIQVRVRPYIGMADPQRGEVGLWSNEIAFFDNVAPCDSDFVLAVNASTLSKGGVQSVEHVSFDNANGSSASDTGYIEITFPEDMDPFGPAPVVTFFYGAFGGAVLTDSLSALPNGTKSGWINARKYRLYISVPQFDFTHNDDGTGAFYNVGVAGCVDASGNVIQTYGSNGSAVRSIASAVRPNRSVAAASQVQGSASVLAGFMLCD